MRRSRDFMKNKLFLMITLSALVVSFVGCGTTTGTAEEATVATGEEEITAESTTDNTVDTSTGQSQDMEMGEIYNNFLEERLQKTTFDSQQEIVDALQSGECYAYVDVLGSDEPVLLISDEYFTGYDEPAVMTCYPYLKNPDGSYSCGSVLSTDSTATPIAVDSEGLIYCAGHTEMGKLAITDENGQGFMYVESVYVEYSEDGTSETYGGFIREGNSFDNETTVAADDSSAFEQAFADYENATIIGFTVVE